MNMPDHEAERFPPLERRDLIRFEQRLRRWVSHYLSYTACSLYFPEDAAPREPEYLPEEERLLLPLYAPCDPRDSGGPDPGAGLEPRLLGIFVARGVSQEDYLPLRVHLPRVMVSVMDNLRLYKAAICDPLTGLYSRRYFLAQVAMQTQLASDALRESSGLAGSVLDPESRAGHPCLGIIVVRLNGLRSIARKVGYLAAEDMLALLGSAMREVCPEQGAAASVSEHELAVMVQAATPKGCRRLALTLLQELSKVGLAHDLTRSQLTVTPSAGFALYPQDITGNVFLRTPEDQAHILLRKARLAAALASDRNFANEEWPVLAFGRILVEGGRVTQTLPLSRLEVSLGSAANAREGQRFSLWGVETPGRDKAGYKGEAVLVEVRDTTSIAEIIHQVDPAFPPAQGDSLLLLPGETWGAARAVGQDGTMGTLDPATGLLRHGDFLAAWSSARENHEAFTLALVSLTPPDRAGQAMDESAQPPTKPEHLLAEAVRLFRDVFTDEADASHILAGRYGLTSWMVFHPDRSPESLADKYEELAALLRSRLFRDREQATLAVGLAGHPYLDFRKADALENCRKALDYGALLPAPHVGVFDSLAMTISADKLFSHGDLLGAVTEYRQALLADEDNALAWNSLGAALARLGRYEEARGHFERALGIVRDAMTLYNLGYCCQSLGEPHPAREYYRQCLELDPDHFYALIRLGQLAEAAGDLDHARTFYHQAGKVDGGRAMVLRYLAGVAQREGQGEQAREFLHESLSLDPHNATAMQMLAALYLDSGEDADVAETLARQSVSVNPDRKSGWLVLARALERSGRRRESREALIRAGAL